MESMHPYLEKSKAQTDDLTAADLLEMKSKLTDELHELQTAHATVSERSEPGDVASVNERIQSLHEQLLKESNDRSTNELILKRIQMSKTLTDVLFTDDVPSENNLYLKRGLEELELASQIKEIHKKTAELQEKVEAQKLTNAELKKENVELMQQLKQNRERTQMVPSEVAQNREYKRLKSELEVKLMSFDIHKNLIQLVVTGMGKDWSQDPELREIMMKCGEPLNL